MGVIGVILLVAFIIICVFLVFMVLVQNDGSGVGGMFGSGNSAAFGSRSGNVLTKTTYIFVTLFFVASFFLAFINRAPSFKGLDAAAAQVQGASGAVNPVETWLNESDDSVQDSSPTSISVDNLDNEGE